jgi:hypothetical protein
MVFEITTLCADLDCSISPVHLYRTDERIQQVDYLSKLKDTDNWSVDHHTFKTFDDDFKFDLDVFADFGNRKTPKFISKFYHPEAVAVDAFSVPWIGMCWICPPVSLILPTTARIRNSRCQGLLIVPSWPASEFFCDLFENGNIKEPFVFIKEFKPYIFQNENAKNTPLFGVTPFTFFALYFDTT